MSGRMVAVVIPAYNAAATLAETLASVRGQTHRALDIVVVDDGSKDATRAIAEAIARADPRVRVIGQANAGVAAARNTGWQSATAELVAFVDADDLWSPDKIERQVAAIEAGGPAIGLVYTWYAMIDRRNTVIYRSEEVLYEGEVLDTILADNFIGNGSAPLVRRDLVEAVGGFEPELHRRKAQGCEDLLFYCRIAERARFAVVPDHLVGYRQTPENMSADLARMLRSWLLVADEMSARHADKAGAIRAGLQRCGRWLAQRAVEEGRYAMLAELVRTMARRDPALAARMLAVDAPAKATARLKSRLRSRFARRSVFVPNPAHRFALGTRFDAGWEAPLPAAPPA